MAYPSASDVEAVTLYVRDVLRKEKPYLFAVEEELRKVQNGVVQCTFRIFNGKVTDFLAVEVKRYTFR